MSIVHAGTGEQLEKKKVYLESSVISYFANRRSRNLIVAAYQEITQEWWEKEPRICTPEELIGAEENDNEE